MTGIVRRTSGENTTVSRSAEAALTQYQFVKQGTGVEEVDVCGAGEAVYGVVETTNSADDKVAVIISGVAEVLVGAGGVAAGARLKSAAAGAAITAAATDPAYARALVAGAAGDVIPVLVGFVDTNTTA